MTGPDAEETDRTGWGRAVGLLLGPLLFLLIVLAPAPAGLSVEGWRAAAVGVLMAVWWVTEAVPIPATALLPIILFPLLGVLGIGDATAPYANPIVFLFLGGFVLALAMQRWQLHRRIALRIVLAVGTEPRRLVLGFMIATAFLSMWVSNTATAVMMMPIGLSVIELVAPRAGAGGPARLNFGTALMLGIAYAASIGGLGTLIGTPPNALLAGYMASTYGVDIGFGRWMLLGVPLVVVSLPLAWLILTRGVFPIRITGIPGGRATITGQLSALGRISAAERRVAAVFVLTAAAWVTRPLLEAVVPGLNDSSIAIAAALILFLLPAGPAGATRATGATGATGATAAAAGPRAADGPADVSDRLQDPSAGRRARLLDWETAERLPWGVLLLFGGGLSLAEAVSATGLAGWIGSSLSALAEWPPLLLILAVTTVIIFLTELTSNTATAAAFLPVLGPLALAVGQDPLLLTVPAAVAASCAFMMPVATPPNAIVYGSGYITIPQMVRAGIWLNLLFSALILGLAATLLPLVFPSS